VNTTNIATRLARTAAGSSQQEAAVWLLIKHFHWLPELSRNGLIDTEGVSDDYAVIDWEEAGCRADAHHLIGTPSELQVLFVACALASTDHTPLFNLSSLDETNRRLVLHAIAWAAGGRAWADTLCLTSPDNCHCPDGADWHQYGCPQFNG
jgi:hypothetical protein